MRLKSKGLDKGDTHPPPGVYSSHSESASSAVIQLFFLIRYTSPSMGREYDARLLVHDLRALVDRYPKILERL